MQEGGLLVGRGAGRRHYLLGRLLCAVMVCATDIQAPDIPTVYTTPNNQNVTTLIRGCLDTLLDLWKYT